MNRPWILRPIVWFASASMATTVLHELTHACVAYALGVRSTLFNFAADLDLTPAQAADDAGRALIGVAGPLVCLGLGAAAWLALRRARGSAAEAPLLYFAVFGAGTFFGNLMSASFVGDFSTAAVALRLPMTVRYAMSLTGALGAAALHVWAGREMARWVPEGVGRAAGTMGIVAAPALLGTAGVILVNLPMPPAFVTSRAAEVSFWVFAAMGAWVGLGRSQLLSAERAGAGPVLRLRWADVAVLVLAVVVVRWMASGIAFTP